jgi:4-aminobutyrate aminotransferase
VSDLRARTRAVFPHWMEQMYAEPLELVRGEGTRVWDSSGREYLDFFGGIVTTISGHRLPAMVEAIERQLATGMVHSSTLYLIEPMVRLAELLVSITPDGNDTVFFVNSGSEAVEAALLLATAHRRSNQVISFRRAYHGRTFGAVAVTGQRGYSATSFSPLNVQYAPYPDPLRSPYDVAACLDELREVVATQTAGDVAALIIEPVQGVNGFVAAPAAFLRGVRELCDEHGIVLISDEVQTGFGRLGDAMWGIEAAGVTADLMVMAKGLGNGLPIGAVVGRADVMNAVTAGSISTFGGNHLVTAGALANVEHVVAADLMGNARARGERLATGLRAIGVDHPHAVVDVRGRGAMQAIELADRDDALTPRPDLTRAVQLACRERGLLVGTGGVAWNVLRLSPPLTFTDADVDEALGIIGAACADVLAVTGVGA